MKRALWIALSLALAHPALAAEKRKPKPAPAQKEQQPAADPKVRDEVTAARYMFRRRVDLCAPPQKCDNDMLAIVDAAEERFMKACRACAPDKRCDDDRRSIRSGKSSGSFDPCE